MTTTLIVFIILFLSPCFANSKTIPCGESSKRIGKESKIVSDGVPLHEGPGSSYPRVVNENTPGIMRRTIFADVDTSVTVAVECINGKWAYVRVINPDYLSESHQGWIESTFLKETTNVKIGTDWYSDWSYDFQVELTKLLASQRVRGCGQYRYRIGITNKDLYIVACSSDGTTWTTYRVSLSKKTVEKLKV